MKYVYFTTDSRVIRFSDLSSCSLIQTRVLRSRDVREPHGFFFLSSFLFRYNSNNNNIFFSPRSSAATLTRLAHGFFPFFYASLFAFLTRLSVFFSNTSPPPLMYLLFLSAAALTPSVFRFFTGRTKTTGPVMRRRRRRRTYITRASSSNLLPVAHRTRVLALRPGYDDHSIIIYM